MYDSPFVDNIRSGVVLMVLQARSPYEMNKKQLAIIVTTGGPIIWVIFFIWCLSFFLARLIEKLD
jgi:hypothetical protein